MNWDDAVEEAKKELGISGYTRDWDEVVKLAKHIQQEDYDNYCEESSIEAKEEHKEYLKSEWWKKIRLKALQRDNHSCQDCKNALATCVHHLTYIHKYNDLELKDITSLCDRCHKKRHGFKVD